jgi:hypothetical protein
MLKKTRRPRTGAQRQHPGFGPTCIRSPPDKDSPRGGKIPPPEKSLFRGSTLVLLSIFYNLVHVAVGMQGFAVFVGRDTAFFQSDGLVANTAGESRMIWPRCG